MGFQHWLQLIALQVDIIETCLSGAATASSSKKETWNTQAFRAPGICRWAKWSGDNRSIKIVSDFSDKRAFKSPATTIF